MTSMPRTDQALRKFPPIPRDLDPPTADDVSVHVDGRRLDTVEKLREVLAEIDVVRQASGARTEAAL